MSDECGAKHPDGVHRCEGQAFHPGPHKYYVDMFTKVEWDKEEAHRGR